MSRISNLFLLSLFVLGLYASSVSAEGEFKFDIAAQIAGKDNYTKHWSNTYPPDSNANIIIFAYAGNMSFKRMSAISFVFVVYDPQDNIVAVEKIDSFQRNYEPAVAYYTLHPNSDWIEGTYKVRAIVYDRIDRQAWENITTDPLGIAVDIEKYKKFYETGSNAEDLGFMQSLGTPVSQAILNFNIDKSATLYPPDRFLLHDVRFVDNNNERILGEKLQIEIMIDNNYKDDGSVKLAMLVDNNVVSTKEVAIKGLDTSTIMFDAKAGKLGTFKLHFGADTPDVKYRNAELTFTIKNETDSSKLDLPKITVTGMNVDKEFVPTGDNVTVSISAINNGRTGNKTITIYSNKVPIGTAEFELQYLEEKTIETPITIKNMGLNKITVSDSPTLFRNVFVQEPESSSLDNPVVTRLKDNPLKVSMVVVFMVFSGVLYYIRKRLA